MECTFRASHGTHLTHWSLANGFRYSSLHKAAVEAPLHGRTVLHCYLLCFQGESCNSEKKMMSSTCTNTHTHRCVHTPWCKTCEMFTSGQHQVPCDNMWHSCLSPPPFLLWFPRQRQASDSFDGWVDTGCQECGTFRSFHAFVAAAAKCLTLDTHSVAAMVGAAGLSQKVPQDLLLIDLCYITIGHNCKNSNTSHRNKQKLFCFVVFFAQVSLCVYCVHTIFTVLHCGAGAVH